MAIETFDGISPDIDESAFVAASADVIGRVSIGEQASVWYNTTLRGDIHEIVIGPRSNIQDNAVVHLADDYGAYIGELVTVGHSAIIHACTIKDEVLVGMGSCILTGQSSASARSLVPMPWSQVAWRSRRARWFWEAPPRWSRH